MLYESVSSPLWKQLCMTWNVQSRENDKTLAGSSLIFSQGLLSWLWLRSWLRSGEWPIIILFEIQLFFKQVPCQKTMILHSESQPTVPLQTKNHKITSNCFCYERWSFYQIAVVRSMSLTNWYFKVFALTQEDQFHLKCSMTLLCDSS